MSNTTTQTFTMVYESPEKYDANGYLATRPDDHWCIEADADGVLHLSSNAMTREPITPLMYRGWDLDQLKADLIADGIPEEIADRYVEQAGR